MYLGFIDPSIPTLAYGVAAFPINRYIGYILMVIEMMHRYVHEQLNPEEIDALWAEILRDSSLFDDLVVMVLIRRHRAAYFPKR